MTPDSKRPPTDPEYRAGSNSGRKQRHTDTHRGTYPREGLPINRDRGPVWVRAYQGAYYQTVSQGRPMLGDEPKVTITVMVDRDLLKRLDALGRSRSEAFQVGILELERRKPLSITVTDPRLKDGGLKTARFS